MKTELENMKILRLSNEESNRVTKECLQIAMFKLMDQEDFEKISITEIAKYAGVSRTAFYRNYESKENLVEDICRSMVSGLKASLCSDTYRTDRKKWYTDFYRTIKENSEYFRIYLNAHLQFEEAFILDSVFAPASPMEHYANSAKEGAFLRILTDWFRGGMKETPDEMAQICEHVIHHAFEVSLGA